MGHAVLWVTSLATAVLFVALTAALASRAGRRWVRWLIPALSALFPLAAGVALTVLGGYLLLESYGSIWFHCFATWTAAALAGTVLIVLSAAGIVRWRTGPAAGARSLPLWIAVAFAAALAATLGSLIYIDIATRSELAALKAEGVALATSLAPPQVPDDENAALVYRRAFEAMGEWDAPDWKRFDRPGIDADAPQTAHFLREHARVLGLLRRAASMPGCHLNEDHTRPYLSGSIDLRKWRRAARLLKLDARHAAASGDSLRAVKGVVAIWNIAVHLSTSPTLVGELTAIAIDGVGVSALENVLAEARPLDEAIKRLAPLDRPDHRDLFARALRYELASQMVMLADPVEASGQILKSLDMQATPAGPLVLYRLYFAFFGRSDVSAYTYYLNGIAKTTGKPMTEAREELGRLRAEFEKRKGGVMTATALSHMFGALRALYRTEAMRRLAELGLAAGVFRSERRKYPSGLSDLVPEYVDHIPADPMDGQPLRMSAVVHKRKEGGLVFYSVGWNGKDEGGRDANTRRPDAETDDDITFCLGSAYEERRLKPAREAAERRAVGTTALSARPGKARKQAGGRPQRRKTDE